MDRKFTWSEHGGREATSGHSGQEDGNQEAEHEESEVLQAQAGDDDRHGLLIRLSFGDVDGDRASHHGWEYRQQPSWRHVLDIQLVVRKQMLVLENRDNEGNGGIQPKQYSQKPIQP